VPPCGPSREAYRRLTVLWRSRWGQPLHPVCQSEIEMSPLHPVSSPCQVDGPLERFAAGPVKGRARHAVAALRHLQLEALTMRRIRERTLETGRESRGIEIDQPLLRPRVLEPRDDAAGRSCTRWKACHPGAADSREVVNCVKIRQRQRHRRRARDTIRQSASPGAGQATRRRTRRSRSVLLASRGAQDHTGDERPDAPRYGSPLVRLMAYSPSPVAQTNNRSFQTRGTHMNPAFQSPIRHRSAPVTVSIATTSPLKNGR
jgi:hypothetical protein